MADQTMLKAILKWSLKQQQEENVGVDGGGSKESEVKEMSKERKKWLKGALDQFVMDETRRINDIVTVLEYDPPMKETAVSETPKTKVSGAPACSENVGAGIVTRGETSPGDGVDDDESDGDELENKLKTATKTDILKLKENCLDELLDRLAQIDNAKFFAVSHGGSGKLELLLQYMKEEDNWGAYPSLRWRAAEAFATIVQNNPLPQARAIDIGCIQFFVRRLRSESNEKVLTKMFYALSCLVRGELSDRALHAFGEEGGLDLVEELLKRYAGRLGKKVLFFLMWVLGDEKHDRLRGKYSRKKDFMNRVVSFANQDDDVDLSEKALTVLQLIAQSKSADVESLRRLMSSINSLVSHLRDLSSKKDADEYTIEATRDRLRLALHVLVAIRKKSEVSAVSE